MKKVFFFIIGFGFLVAILFRFYSLGNIPNSLDWDEASLGYNAYSILHTGKDEYGNLFPFILRSFNDYKPGLYVYFTIPFIQVFGMTAFAVRLASALMGILAIIGTYFLVRELFRTQNFKEKEKKYGKYLPILAALLLALSPWHIQFSRVAFEANSALTASIFGVVFFLIGRRKPNMLFLSAICFSATLYLYQSAKVFTPLFGLLLIFIFRSDMQLIAKKYMVGACIIFILFVSPLIVYTINNPQSLSRLNAVNSLQKENQFFNRSLLRIEESKASNDILGQLFNNRRIVMARSYIENYLSHFSLNWLFISGDFIPRHQPPFFGHMYLWELPFLLLGVYFLFWGKFTKKTKLLIFGWILIAPLPATPTIDVPHAVRTLTILPIPQILTAIGLLETFLWVQSLNKKIRLATYFLYFTVSIFILINVAYYANQYFVQQNYYHAKYWQYGFKEAIDYLDTIKKNNKIIFSESAVKEQAYIFYLFYSRYNPKKYLASGGSEKIFQQCFSVENVLFGSCQEKLADGDIYIVYGTRDGINSLHEIKHIVFPNNDPAISIYEYRK